MPVAVQDAGYLKREKDARNFQGHLAMFASRAHLWNQQHGMSKADLNALIMQEVAQQDVGVGTSAHKAQPQGDSVQQVDTPSTGQATPSWKTVAAAAVDDKVPGGCPRPCVVFGYQHLPLTCSVVNAQAHMASCI